MFSLVNGVRNFQANVFESQRELFTTLGQGQHPETLFITCSDSRISEHLVTQSQPGDLFVIRNAGNIVPTVENAIGGVGASIEYAIKALGVSHVVVCGHSQCGAMKGLLHPETLGELPLVAKWLENGAETRRIVDEKYGDLDDKEKVRVTAEENVIVQLKNLATHPAVAEAMANKKLELHGWMYTFETGDVTAYDPAQDKFVPLSGDTIEDSIDADKN